MDKKNMKEDDKNKLWKLESRWDTDFKELRKGNPMLTVGKQKNNLIFPISPLKSSNTGNRKYWKCRSKWT